MPAFEALTMLDVGVAEYLAKKIKKATYTRTAL
jgi:hypothetical protein